jgi:hypothetical protein
MTAPRILRYFALALILALPSAAQNTAPQGGRIEGDVRTPSGAPVSGATARLGPREGRLDLGPSGVSGDDGHFVIANVPESREYILRVEAPGYRLTAYNASGIEGVETPLTIQNGSVIKVKIVLTPAGTISGKVVDADGNPVKRMTVTALRGGYFGGQYRLLSSAGTMANDQGEFQLPKLPEGDYYLLAEGQSTLLGMAPARPNATPPAAVGETYVDTYFPSSLDRAGAVVLHIAPGVDLPSNTITLRKEKAFSISGVVKDALTGNPASGIHIQAMRQEGRFAPTPSVSGPDGAFVFPRVPPGTYTFQATALSSGSLTGQPVSIRDSDASDVRLSLRPDELITGKITMEDGKPLDAGDVMVALDNRTQNNNDRRFQAELKKDLTFEMRLTPSSYAVMVHFSHEGQGYFLSKIKLDGVDLKPSSTINIPPGGASRLELVLSPHAAKLTGAVTDSDGKPLGGIPIFALPKAPSEGLSIAGIGFAESDQDGRFQIVDLAPGAYYVVAVADIHASDFANFELVLDALARKAGGREEVTLSKDSSTGVFLKISR